MAKFYKGLAFILAAFAALGSVSFAQDVAFPIGPAPLQPGNFRPDVFLSTRALDIGIELASSTINPTDLRTGFYAFTGERIFYVVVVRDPNGKDDIQTVMWQKQNATGQFEDEQGPCTDVTSAVLVDPDPNGPDTKNSHYCFADDLAASFGSEVVVPTTVNNCPTDYTEVQIDTSTNLQWDPQTDKLYKCILTVEPGWGGADPPIKVTATDTSGSSGSTLTESWTFNPPLSVNVDTSDGQSLAFGAPILDQDVPGSTAPNCVVKPGGTQEDLTFRDCRLYPESIQDDPEKKCDVSFSTNKLVLTNTGIPNLWPFIAADNFQASNTIGQCPFTNELHANQFAYRAMSGTFDSGWRFMPQYAPNLGCMGIDLGASSPLDLIFGQCRGGCRIPTGGTFGVPSALPGIDILSPGHHIEVALKIVWPTPCIGVFDTGNIYAIVRAV